MNIPVSPASLRLLPGIIIISLQFIIRFLLPTIIPGDDMLAIGAMSGLLGGLAILVWWVFFSRAVFTERWTLPLVTAGVMVAVSFGVHHSIATANMGLMYAMFSIPPMCLLFVLWVVLARGSSGRTRYITFVVTVLLGSLPWLLLRTNGMDADLNFDFEWRWAGTAEEKLISREQPTAQTVTVPDTVAQWPGFRGAGRDSIIPAARINTNWKTHPPRLLWKKQIGPGCSSFAVHGQLLYTQEQRGKYEAVSCYDVRSGTLLWLHKDKARFYDSHAGAGPRSTPTLALGRVYTLGATGILNALRPEDGSVIWSRHAAQELGKVPLEWGFSSSPLVTDGLVIIALAGTLAAYDAQTGELRWSAESEANSYSSAHLAEIAGHRQLLFIHGDGIHGRSVSDGTSLWTHEWKISDRILQPALLPGGDLLVTRETFGLRRLTFTSASGAIKPEVVWTSTKMRLNFNDMVVHQGHVYGFDGPFLTCLSQETGERTWRGGKYRGWILLFKEQEQLVVLTEKGELALVPAQPDAFCETGRIPAIAGKTWNHPAFSDGVIFVRNAREMAAFSLAGSEI